VVDVGGGCLCMILQLEDGCVTGSMAHDIRTTVTVTVDIVQGRDRGAFLIGREDSVRAERIE
jgi:hypothetical protein